MKSLPCLLSATVNEEKFMPLPLARGTIQEVDSLLRASTGAMEANKHARSVAFPFILTALLLEGLL